MKFTIKHEIRGRMRIRVKQQRMTQEQGDLLYYYLSTLELVTSVKVNERLLDVVVCYKGSREEMIHTLQNFHYDNVELPEVYEQNSGRQMNQYYWDKLVTKVAMHMINKVFLPYSCKCVIACVKSVKYLYEGVKIICKGKLEVPVLDATAIGVSLLRNDIKTVGSVTFLLGIGELLEEWTHKKSVDDLARSMSLNISKVWLCKEGQPDQLVCVSKVRQSDIVRVHMGNVIPFDGVVVAGEAMVNQASLTGEAIPVRKVLDGYVYAGTVVEEGEIQICVKEANGSSRYEKIVTMIEESEKLKSALEDKASHLADSLVPYTFAGTGLVYFVTRNVTKALSVLMVDFSCALKLAMPIAVLSAIREASTYNITVKGGKYLEAMAEVDTVDVISFSEETPDELLRIAACLEEHFPHSMAKAVVDAATEKQLVHEELHSKVEYIVAHGISSTIENKKVVIGSAHFVFEDEACRIPEEYKEQYEQLSPEYSHLYMAIDNVLVAVICIEDPLREEAAEIVKSLKQLGISKVVMMTGDSERTARAIAARVGVDEYHAEVLPEDKAAFVEAEKVNGRKVAMIGDGINDSPALSAADIGIAVSDGAEIAREIADVTIAADNLYEIVTLKKLSNTLMKRIRRNYRIIVGFNCGLIGLGVAGIITPTTSALLHNTSTLTSSVRNMRNCLETK